MHIVTIVTGGSTGIGSEIARQAATDSHEVIVVSRRPGPVGHHVPIDLSQPAGWSTFGATVADVFLRADQVEIFHCAGTLSPIGFAGETDSDAYRANVLLNSAAPQILGEAVLREAMSRSVAVTLVMITSGAARNPYPGWSAYGAGKAAMDQWVRITGEEQRIRGGVKVVGIAPGVVDTPMQAEIRATDESRFPSVQRFRDQHSDGALLDPAEVARRIRAVIDQLDSGAVVDLRDL